MHALIWIIHDRRYAIDAHRVVEVVPVVEPRPMDGVDDWVCGLMNYRGRLLPLLDGRVLLGAPCPPPRRNQRILVLRLDEDDATRLAGLIVDRLIGVETIEMTGDDVHPGLAAPDAPHLGPVALAGGDTVQLVEPLRLLDDERRHVLFGRSGSAET